MKVIVLGASALSLSAAVKAGLGQAGAVRVAVCPPAV